MKHFMIACSLTLAVTGIGLCSQKRLAQRVDDAFGTPIEPCYETGIDPEVFEDFGGGGDF